MLNKRCYIFIITLRRLIIMHEAIMLVVVIIIIIMLINLQAAVPTFIINTATMSVCYMCVCGCGVVFFVDLFVYLKYCPETFI